MDLIRTFQSIPANYKTEGVRQARTQPWRKSLAHRPQVAELVVEREEEWEQIQRALAGGVDALSTPFTRRRIRLYRPAFSLLRNRDEAEETLQEDLLSAFVELRSFEGRARFSAWLTRIAFNAPFMNRRTARACSQISLYEIVVNDDGPPRAVVLIDDHLDPEQLLVPVEIRDALKRVTSQLPPLLRSVFELRDSQELFGRETAEAAILKTCTVKPRTLRTSNRRVFLPREATSCRLGDPRRLGWTGCVKSERINTHMTDLEIKDNVESELTWEPSVNAAEIGVAVKDGVVTLTGRVESDWERVEAERAAARVLGVKAVADELEIRLPDSSERTDEDIAMAAVDTLKWSLLVPSRRIKIKVSKGWVTLEGTVDWEFQKNAAEKAVRKLTGVRGVSNLVEVKPHVSKGDVKTAIEAALKRNAQVDARRIKVEADGDKVTLRGTVRSSFEREEAERAAWRSPGVRNVENRITIGEVAAAA
jgi:osmotically-inducible protein OsmY/DNA-directed RNA polymerase specialized sigma24 family protein